MAVDEVTTMFTALRNREIIMICYGLLAMIVFVLIGLTAAESQMNSLTLQRDCVQIFNVKREITHQDYVFYLLGHQYRMRGMVLVGQVYNHSTNIEFRLGEYFIKVPTYIGMECKTEFFLIHQRIHWCFHELVQAKAYVQREIRSMVYR